MRDKQVEAKFKAVLENNRLVARKAQESREAYRTAWARAYLNSTEKNDTGRKASADEATSRERTRRDLDQIDLDATYHELLFLRGPEVLKWTGEE